MNDVTVFLKVIKLPVVSKLKTIKVDMSYIEEIFAEFNYL